MSCTFSVSAQRIMRLAQCWRYAALCGVRTCVETFGEMMLIIDTIIVNDFVDENANDAINP